MAKIRRTPLNESAILQSAIIHESTPSVCQYPAVRTPALPLLTHSCDPAARRQLSVSCPVTCDVTARRQLVSAPYRNTPPGHPTSSESTDGLSTSTARLGGGGGGSARRRGLRRGRGRQKLRLQSGRPAEVMSDGDVTCLPAAAADKWGVFSGQRVWRGGRRGIREYEAAKGLM